MKEDVVDKYLKFVEEIDAVLSHGNQSGFGYDLVARMVQARENALQAGIDEWVAALAERWENKAAESSKSADERETLRYCATELRQSLAVQNELELLARSGLKPD